jgi:tetratricopeptide (TPR) repeat protein
VEQLEALARQHPASIAVRTKLRDLYGDMGNMPKAVAHMIVLADLYEGQGRRDEAEQLLQAAQGMDPGNAELQARLAPPAPAEESAILQDLIPEDGGTATTDTILLEPEAPAASSGDELFNFGQSAPFEEIMETPPAPEPAPQARPREAAARPAAPSRPAEAAPPPRQSAPEPVMQAEPEAPPAPPVEEIDLNEIWAEAEFYYQQGLFDEARKHYEKILQFDADNARVLARISEINREQEHADEFSKLADAVDELEGLDAAFGGTPPPLPAHAAQEDSTSSSDEDAVRSLMQEIAQLKQKPAPPKPAAPLQPSRSAPLTPQPAEEDDFFDLGAELNEESAAPSPFRAAATSSSSDDFFDLASELRDELSTVSVPAASSSSPEEQSLDEIFDDFKKGVEQQAIKEDADTHYNLGVAYKEMGLLDDAISEFVMTPEDEPKYVQSRYMLGLCYMEQGDYENSIIELKNALDCADQFGVSAEDHMGMCYDLGLAYQGTGDARNALLEFQKVYTVDPRFRDVAGKILALQKGGISQQQLKTDIEREISSKFLAEGERIQREEKTRKNERVPRPW